MVKLIKDKNVLKIAKITGTLKSQSTKLIKKHKVSKKQIKMSQFSASECATHLIKKFSFENKSFSVTCKLVKTTKTCFHFSRTKKHHHTNKNCIVLLNKNLYFHFAKRDIPVDIEIHVGVKPI